MPGATASAAPAPPTWPSGRPCPLAMEAATQETWPRVTVVQSLIPYYHTSLDE